MTVSIVACGPSAKEWYKTPCDLSIGVNDCLKFGHEVDYLVVVNSPLKFTPRDNNGHRDRLKIIKESKPKKFLCHTHNWFQWFPQAELLPLRHFSGSVRKGLVYKSHTSPFVALSIAFNEGASDIVIWGVDFLEHPHVKGKLLKSELLEYKKLFEALEKQGIRIYIGNDQTVLKNYLPVWTNILTSTHNL